MLEYTGKSVKIIKILNREHVTFVLVHSLYFLPPHLYVFMSVKTWGGGWRARLNNIYTHFTCHFDTPHSLKPRSHNNGGFHIQLQTATL